jgi:hypothetical protein
MVGRIGSAEMRSWLTQFLRNPHPLPSDPGSGHRRISLTLPSGLVRNAAFNLRCSPSEALRRLAREHLGPPESASTPSELFFRETPLPAAGNTFSKAAPARLSVVGWQSRGDALGKASKETYDQAVASADLVICATDNRVSRLICNRLSIKHRKKVIFGGLSSGAYAGMVFQCRSPETMCYHCFVSSFPEAAADRESNESEYSGGPDGHLALDIVPITNLMAKLAIVELQRQAGMDVPNGLNADLAAPWFLWINRRDGEYSELDPLGSPVKGLQILQWRPVPMEKIEGCPHCGIELQAK